MRRLFPLLFLLLLSGCVTRADLKECRLPGPWTLHAARAWEDSLAIVRAPELCTERTPEVVVFYDVEALPEVCSGHDWRACAVDRRTHYEVHLLPGWDYHTLVHEFLHVQMWRLGWEGSSHHDRMERLGFPP